MCGLWVCFGYNWLGIFCAVFPREEFQLAFAFDWARLGKVCYRNSCGNKNYPKKKVKEIMIAFFKVFICISIYITVTYKNLTKALNILGQKKIRKTSHKSSGCRNEIEI